MSGGPLTDQVDLQPLRAGRADLLHIEGDFIAGGKMSPPGTSVGGSAAVSVDRSPLSNVSFTLRMLVPFRFTSTVSGVPLGWASDRLA
ncbi:hypothetical protein SNK04_014102 [Fusarium graminearum]